MMSSAAHLLEMKSLTLLGSTGSIGANTLDVVRHNPDLYRVHALAAGQNVDAILQQIIEFRPEVAVLATSQAIDRLAAALSDSGLPRPNWPELAFGAAALVETATAPCGRYGDFGDRRRRGTGSDLRSGALGQTGGFGEQRSIGVRRTAGHGRGEGAAAPNCCRSIASIMASTNACAPATATRSPS